VVGLTAPPGHVHTAQRAAIAEIIFSLDARKSAFFQKNLAAAQANRAAKQGLRPLCEGADR
jgi:hypothetical protein